MKIKALTTIALLAFAGLSQAAVTFNFATHTGSANGPNGLPIVNNAGAAVLNSSNSVFASIGYFLPGVNLTSPLDVLAKFVPLDNSPLTPIIAPTNRDGLINGPDYSSAGNVYPAGFQGQTAYILVGNNSVLANSTAIALFTGLDTGGATTFLAPDGLGNRVQSFSLTSDVGRVVLGTVRAVTTQPVAGNTFANGVSMVPVPEPSAALLGAIGALGLLRRRRA
jgi:hypothetical protein